MISAIEQWSNAADDGESDDDDPMVTLEVYGMGGSIRSLQIWPDVSIGHLEARLEGYDIRRPSGFTVGPPDAPVAFAVHVSYNKFIFAKVVKDSIVCPQENNKLLRLRVDVIY